MNVGKAKIKGIGLIIACAVVVTGCSSTAYNPGVYEGTGEGHGGEIVLSVTVSEKKIESIEIKEFNDSEFAVEPANKLIANIISKNSAEIDGVSGASNTSKGILDAAKEAVGKAKK